MDLFSNDPILRSTPSNSRSNSKSSDGYSQENNLLSGILDSLTTWDITNELPDPKRTSTNITFGCFDSTEFLSTIGADVRCRKESPHSNHSIISCGWCDLNATDRCLDCNEFLCKSCLNDHRLNTLSCKHNIKSLPKPIGTSPIDKSTMESGCDEHAFEQLRYVCEHCKKLICQQCIVGEHKDHTISLILSFVDEASGKIESALESGRIGTKCIKSSIDSALSYIRTVERDSQDVSDNIRKAFRQYILAIEDRERLLLEMVQKLRLKRLSLLNEQMAGLKSALTGLAETTEILNNVSENASFMSQTDIAVSIVKSQRQLEQLASIYKGLRPKTSTLVFTPPDFDLLQELRCQGNVSIVEDKNIVANTVGNKSNYSSNHLQGAYNFANRLKNSPDNSYCISPSTTLARKYDDLEWTFNPIPLAVYYGTANLTQSVPGTLEPVRVRRSNALSLSFALEGYEDGKVSRPWGLCVDKNGNILISDRRNNRVQVFNSNGMFKFNFGRKGIGNGEFDLPAGICVDIDNRIIVVDKDNHRVQIFHANGVFMSKFGKYGKEYGQFQYPWDVAVNSRRQIVVTDSRNNRIQQFDSEGRFIRQIVFDNSNQNKGIASPRGVCYTPQGNIIVSDFDNHCLYLIDCEINEIISAKGHEGSGLQQFNRPSGITCDDDGCVIVADSKNQRAIVFSPTLDYLWDIEIRPSKNYAMPKTLDEKDRICDVALMPDGRVVFIIELSPDSKDGYNLNKHFVHIF